MKKNLEQFCRGFEAQEGSVRRLSKDFCETLGLTVFAYVRVTDEGRTSWVTSNAEQDRLLLESKALEDEPGFDTKASLKEGCHLWFNDRKFTGSDEFYHKRKMLYHMDHGMILVRHQKNYLETCCFSGLLEKKPLYNLFMNQQKLFSSFMDHFIASMDRKIHAHLDEGFLISEVKKSWGIAQDDSSDFTHLAALCGYKKLLLLSSQEKRCLILLKEGHSYPAIGKTMHLSPRTIEHYLESIKNKLGVDTRPELCELAEKLLAFGLY